MASKPAHVVLFLLSAMGCLMIAGAATYSRQFIVGGSYGWKSPPNSTFYQEWAQTKNFVVGDKLVFLFTTSLNNVVEVSADDFAACTKNSVIDVHHNGPTSLELPEPGPRYYFSGLGMHCQEGQKFSIYVTTVAAPVSEDSNAAAAPAAAPPSNDGDGHPTTTPDQMPTSSATSVRYAATSAGVCLYILLSLLA